MSSEAEPKRCIPCESADASSLLSEAEVTRRLAGLCPSWRLVEGHKIAREFVAKDFVEAVEYFGRLAAIAEKFGHHPDLHLTRYRYVEIVLYTHSVNGLTENDFFLANELDTVPVKYAPKWISDNPQVTAGRDVPDREGSVGPL